MSSLFVFLFGYATMVSMFLLGRRIRLSQQIAYVRAEILQPKVKQDNVVLTEKTRQSIL